MRWSFFDILILIWHNSINMNVKCLILVQVIEEASKNVHFKFGYHDASISVEIVHRVGPLFAPKKLPWSSLIIHEMSKLVFFSKSQQSLFIYAK